MNEKVLELTDTQHTAFGALKQRGIGKALTMLYDKTDKEWRGNWYTHSTFGKLLSIDRETLASAITGAIKVEVKLTPVERINRLFLQAEAERNRFLREAQQPEMSVAYTKMEAYKKCLDILMEADKDGQH